LKCLVEGQLFLKPLILQDREENKGQTEISERCIQNCHSVVQIAYTEFLLARLLELSLIIRQKQMGDGCIWYTKRKAALKLYDTHSAV